MTSVTLSLYVFAILKMVSVDLCKDLCEYYFIASQPVYTYQCVATCCVAPLLPPPPPPPPPRPGDLTQTFRPTMGHLT